MVIVTFVPGSPRNCRTASCRPIFSVILPLILMMRSPGSKPALAPGVSSIGATTVRKPSLDMLMTMPMPPNLPSVSSFMSSYACGSMNWLCGSRELTIPLSAPYVRSRYDTALPSTYSLRTNSMTCVMSSICA